MRQKSFLSGDDFENFTTLELIAIANKASLLEKARAIFWLAKRCDREEEIIPQVIEKIFDSQNRRSKIFIYTVSFFGISGLFEANTPNTKQIINDFIQTLSEYERSDLDYFLKQLYPRE